MFCRVAVVLPVKEEAAALQEEGLMLHPSGACLPCWNSAPWNSGCLRKVSFLVAL